MFTMHISPLSQHFLCDAIFVYLREQPGGKRLFVALVGKRHRFQLPRRKRSGEVVVAVECVDAFDQPLLQAAIWLLLIVQQCSLCHILEHCRQAGTLSLAIPMPGQFIDTRFIQQWRAIGISFQHSIGEAIVGGRDQRLRLLLAVGLMCQRRLPASIPDSYGFEHIAECIDLKYHLVADTRVMCRCVDAFVVVINAFPRVGKKDSMAIGTLWLHSHHGVIVL